MKDKMKKCFSTPKRAVISTLCIVVIILIIVGVIAAAVLKSTHHRNEAVNNRGAVSNNIDANEKKNASASIESNTDNTSSAQNPALSEDEAKAAALADANLTEEEVTFVKVKLDSGDQVQVYDVEFYTAEAEYDYEISAVDGAVVEKDISAFRGDADQNSNNANASDKYIGVDSAKQIAVEHAGLSESDVVFSKAKLENDDGRTEYEISFYSGNTEYEYSIDAASGKILEYDVEAK